MNKLLNFTLLRIIISLILFIVSLFTTSSIEFVLILISYIIISYEVFKEALEEISEFNFFNECFLMVIATLGAFYIGSYEEAVMVMLLFEFGEYLSDLAVNKSKKSITQLMDLKAEKTNLLKNNKIVEVETKDVKIDDIFIVKPGEKIPVDGVVIDGESFIDTSAITGELTPRRVKTKDKILSGFINNDSVIKVKATSTINTSTTSKILSLIENSNEKKSNTEKFITRFAKIYTPIIIISAALLVLIPTLLGQDFNKWLYKALIFLVTSCPCALVISVPLGYFCGIGAASKNGAIIKGSSELESLSNVDYLLLDKTGTITEGVFEVIKINSKYLSDEDFLNIIASAEENSLHPIAMAIKEKSKSSLKKATKFKEIAGKGIMCLINDKEVLVGNKKLLEENNISVDNNNDTGTIVYLAIDKKYQGYLVIADKIKESSMQLKNIEKLINRDIVILSGDNNEYVKNVAETLKIDNYFSNLLPQEKVEKMSIYLSKGKTMFVGDGINDAPVIKKADIGVSMGTIGSDAAIEASDIVIMNDNIETLEKIIKIGINTKKKVIQSIIFALVIKFIILLLGVIGISSIWMAVFADVGVTLLSILNVVSIFLKKY